MNKKEPLYSTYSILSPNKKGKKTNISLPSEFVVEQAKEDVDEIKC